MIKYEGYITDVPGIQVGHHTDPLGRTGLTVVFSERGMACGVDVRGAAPGTRETDLLRPGNLVEKINAVVLSGGSAYGLNSVGGVMQYLEERGIGFPTASGVVPIVPAAVLYDLSVGDPKIRPTAQDGYLACKNARADEDRQGAVGAGTGATVGKLLGQNSAMPGGLGSASLQIGDLIVSAIVAVNALGDIFDHETGQQLAGPLSQGSGEMLSTERLLLGGIRKSGAMENTTIGVIATNGKLHSAQINRMAIVAHDGYAHSIRPVHTMADGDAIFTLATGEVEADLNQVLVMAVEVISRAISNAVLAERID
ncbi:MAG: P1 family peptidase [Tissierellia bacterium]|nr:P1 family peptidase [Tissierellia bacterium]